jgi:hypothetical protein
VKFDDGRRPEEKRAEVVKFGRHATFRALYSKGCGGSSPPFGTRERLKQGYKRLEAFLLSIDSKTDSKTAKFGEFI